MLECMAALGVTCVIGLLCWGYIKYQDRRRELEYWERRRTPQAQSQRGIVKMPKPFPEHSIGGTIRSYAHVESSPHAPPHQSTQGMTLEEVFSLSPESPLLTDLSAYAKSRQIQLIWVRWEEIPGFTGPGTKWRVLDRRVDPVPELEMLAASKYAYREDCYLYQGLILCYRVVHHEELTGVIETTETAQPKESTEGKSFYLTLGEWR